MNNQRCLPIQYSRYKHFSVDFMLIIHVRHFKCFDCYKFPRQVFFAQIALKFTYEISIRISACLFMLWQASPSVKLS